MGVKGMAVRARMPTAAYAGLPTPRRYVAIVALSLGTILTQMDGQIVNVALPTLARDLHVHPSAAVLVVTVYQLVMMMALLPFSALGDRVGHRALYQYGQIVFVAATLLCFFAKSLPFLVLVRGFQALGGAAAMSVGSAMVRRIYPSTHLGRGLAFNTVMAASAATLAPTIGGSILAVARWPWLFALVVPFGVLSVLIGRKSLPDDGVLSKESYDVLGAVMCAGTFGVTVVGLESLIHGDSPVISSVVVALGIVLGIIFVRRELGQPLPVLPIDLFRQKTIALSATGLLSAYIASMVLMVTLPFRLQQQYHYSPAESGAMIAPWPLISMFVAPSAGMLSDRIPAGLLGGIGMVLGFGGMASFAFLPDPPNHLDILWRVALVGLGFGLFYSPNARQIIGSAPVHRAAAAGALTSTVRGAGQTFGSTLVALLLATGVGTGATPPLICAGLAVIAGICAVAVLRPAVRQPGIEDLPEL